MTLGEVQPAIEKATKQESGLPSVAAVASGSGKVLPTIKQVDALLSGKSIDITLYGTTDKLAAGIGFGQLVAGLRCLPWSSTGSGFRTVDCTTR